MVDKNVFRRKYWRNILFRHCDHPKDSSGERVCALEALNYARCGVVEDDLPCGARESMSVLMSVNDCSFWKSNKARTTFLKPFVQRFALLGQNPMVERAANDAVIRYVKDVVQPPEGDYFYEYIKGTPYHAPWAAEQVIAEMAKGSLAYYKKHMKRVLEILTDD